MKFRPSSIVLSIVISASMLTACASSSALSPQPMAMPSAELMTTPPKVARPPIAPDPVTGASSMRGAEALPWAIDTVAVAGELRSMVVRLQTFIREAVLRQPSDRKAP